MSLPAMRDLLRMRVVSNEHRGRGEATYVGRSTMVTRCRVETCEGKLLTEATFTLFVLPPKE